MVTDPVGDMLTRINNAKSAGRGDAVLPYSRFKQDLAQFFLKKDFIAEVKTFKEGGRKSLRLVFKVGEGRGPFFRRISKPGRRIYRGAKALLSFSRGKRIAIVSTSRGLMTAVEAKRRSLGGEVICVVE